MRWGFPPAKAGSKTPITNIRNLDSRWWRDVNREWMMEPDYRCLVPFSRFAEWDVKAKANAWFSTTTDQSFMAGVWRPWKGERLMPVGGQARRQRIEAELDLFAFLTTDPNSIVAPIHGKAMPVILTEPDECREWLCGGEDSLRLQRPLRDDQLKVWSESSAE